MKFRMRNALRMAKIKFGGNFWGKSFVLCIQMSLKDGKTFADAYNNQRFTLNGSRSH